IAVANAANVSHNYLILLDGASEEIRTPDPQIRSLELAILIRCHAPHFAIVSHRSAFSQRARLQPQTSCSTVRVNAGLFPPAALVAVAMNLAMVPTTECNDPFVADLSSKCAVLRKA